MTTIEVFSTRNERRSLGTISWDGEKFVLSNPKSTALKLVLDCEIETPEFGTVGPDRPELFLSLLHRKNSGFPLLVTEARN